MHSDRTVAWQKAKEMLTCDSNMKLPQSQENRSLFLAISGRIQSSILPSIQHVFAKTFCCHACEESSEVGPDLHSATTLRQQPLSGACYV